MKKNKIKNSSKCTSFQSRDKCGIDIMEVILGYALPNTPLYSALQYRSKSVSPRFSGQACFHRFVIQLWVLTRRWRFSGNIFLGDSNKHICAEGGGGGVYTGTFQLCHELALLPYDSSPKKVACKLCVCRFP